MSLSVETVMLLDAACDSTEKALKEAVRHSEGFTASLTSNKSFYS